MVDAVDATVDAGQAPAGQLAVMLRYVRRLYASPAVFAAVFTVGFLVTFVPGALIFLSAPDLAELYRQGSYDVVVADLRTRKEAGLMEPEDWVILGNALERRYGGVVRGEMLEAYLAAAQNRHVDAVALNNTLVALGDEKYQQKAIEVLAAWPPSTDENEDPTRLLAGRMREEGWLSRHGALEALKGRAAPADVVAQAEAVVAVTDVQSWTCERGATPAGVRALMSLVEAKATDALKQAVPATLVLEPHSVELSRVGACLKPHELSRLQAALATVVK